MRKLAFLAVFLFGVHICSHASFAHSDFRAEVVFKNTSVTWAFTWLPNGDMLISERGGKVLRVHDGNIIAEIKGVPTVRAKGQGGLLDLVLHPAYETNQLVYMSYSDPSGGGGSNTAVARARLNGNSFEDLEVLYKAQPNTRGGNHFGSRIAFDRKGYLFFSVGDRGARKVNPQDINRDGGKVYRLHDDGRVPSDNPFLDSETPAIYSLGHRNIQGMTVHQGSGEVWTHEHGPRGGDEINIIEPGHNYGWPILSYGVNYNGTKFAEGTERSGFKSPLWYWVPSIAPSGMVFVTSDNYPNWKGHLLVGSLKFGQLIVCEIDSGSVKRAEVAVDNLGRVRDVRQGPDGYIYVAVDGSGVKRIVPET